MTKRKRKITPGREKELFWADKLREAYRSGASKRARNAIRRKMNTEHEKWLSTLTERITLDDFFTA